MINEYKKQYDTLEDLGYEVEMISQFENYNNNSYICDIISEISDNYVNIYNHQLWELAPLISDYIEESLMEFGTPSEIDLVKIFQTGQFYYNERVFYENLEDIIFNIALDFLDDEISLYCKDDRQFIFSNLYYLICNIEVEISNLNNNNRIEEIEDCVKQLVSLLLDEKEEQ